MFAGEAVGIATCVRRVALDASSILPWLVLGRWTCIPGLYVESPSVRHSWVLGSVPLRGGLTAPIFGCVVVRTSDLTRFRLDQ